MFWMQGELDSLTIQAADYRQHFLSMYQDFTARVPVEKCGIITTRTAAGTHKYTDDLYFTGPRIAQYGMGASPELSNIYVVCNVHEQWITDEGTAQFPESLSVWHFYLSGAQWGLCYSDLYQ